MPLILAGRIRASDASCADGSGGAVAYLTVQGTPVQFGGGAITCRFLPWDGIAGLRKQLGRRVRLLADPWNMGMGCAGEGCSSHSRGLMRPLSFEQFQDHVPSWVMAWDRREYPTFGWRPVMSNQLGPCDDSLVQNAQLSSKSHFWSRVR